MKDRIPTYPGRVTLTPVAGDTYDMVMADEPTEAGTPPTKANLLTDQTANFIWPDPNDMPADPTVNLALAELASGGSIGETVVASSALNKFDPVSVYGGRTAKSASDFKGGSAYSLSTSGHYSVTGKPVWVKDDTVYVLYTSDSSDGQTTTARTKCATVDASGTMTTKTTANLSNTTVSMFIDAVKIRDGVAVGFWAGSSALQYAILNGNKTSSSSVSLTQVPRIAQSGLTNYYAKHVLPIVIDENTILLFLRDTTGSTTPSHTAFMFMTIPADLSATTPTATFSSPIEVTNSNAYEAIADLGNGRAIVIDPGTPASCAVITYTSSTASLGTSVSMSNCDGSANATECAMYPVGSDEAVYYLNKGTSEYYTHIYLDENDAITESSQTTITIDGTTYGRQYRRSTFLPQCGLIVTPLLTSSGAFYMSLYNVFTDGHNILQDSSGNTYTTYTSNYSNVVGGDEKGVVVGEALSVSSSSVVDFVVTAAGNMGIVTSAASAGDNVKVLYNGVVIDSDVTRGLKVKTDGVRAYAPVDGKLDVSGWWVQNIDLY